MGRSAMTRHRLVVPRHVMPQRTDAVTGRPPWPRHFEARSPIITLHRDPPRTSSSAASIIADGFCGFRSAVCSVHDGRGMPFRSSKPAQAAGRTCRAIPSSQPSAPPLHKVAIPSNGSSPCLPAARREMRAYNPPPADMAVGRRRQQRPDVASTRLSPTPSASARAADGLASLNIPPAARQISSWLSTSVHRNRRSQGGSSLALHQSCHDRSPASRSVPMRTRSAALFSVRLSRAAKQVAFSFEPMSRRSTSRTAPGDILLASSRLGRVELVDA